MSDRSDLRLDVVIPCMGRLAHLRESLPAALALDGPALAVRVTVVDYSCPERSGDWVERSHPGARVVRAGQREAFGASESRNLGARAGDAPWILFLDADVVVDPALATWLAPRLEPGVSWHCEPRLRGTGGTFVCARADFERVGGYDEVFRGWGGEDFDLHERLAAAGVERRGFPARLLRPIAHGDDLRTRHHRARDPEMSLAVNRLYRQLKQDLATLTGVHLGREDRERLYAHGRAAIEQALGPGGAGDLHLVLGRERLAGLERSRVLHYHLDRTPGRWRPEAPPGPPEPPPLAEALRTVAERWPDLRSPSEAEPVFVLAAGFRSGSTLLQRALMRHCWVWGEPYGRAGVIEHLAEPWRRITTEWPRAETLDRALPDGADPAAAWIANLYPGPEALLRAAVTHLETLLGAPARARGYERWGLKEVRLDAGHAAFLRRLFPRARLLFLVRDPFAAYRSFRRYGRSWYLRWPERPVAGPGAFGHHWATLAAGFREAAAGLDALLIRYEDLTAPGADLAPIERHLGFGLDRAALARRVAGVPEGGWRDPGDLAAELAVLDDVVGSAAAAFGYRRPA